MDQTFIESLDLQDVKQNQLAKNRIIIAFTVNETVFELFLHFNLGGKKVFYPHEVIHSNQTKKLCSLCGTNYSYVGHHTVCTSFKDHYDQLFRRLIEMPSIRLEWLYLPYDEKERNEDGKSRRKV